MPLDQIRNLLLIAFILLAFMLWQAWQRDYAIQPETSNSQLGYNGVSGELENENKNNSNAIADRPKDVPQISDVPQTSESVTGIDDQDITAGADLSSNQSATVMVETDIFRARFSTSGATLISLLLKDYSINKEDKENVIALFDNSAQRKFILQSGFLSNTKIAPSHRDLWQSEQTNYFLNENQSEIRVPFVWQHQNGLTITKTFVFHRSKYEIDILTDVRNKSGATWSGHQYAQFLRNQPVDTSSGLAVPTYTGGVVSTTEKIYRKLPFDEVADEPLAINETGGWIAMIEHYFAAAIVPLKQTLNHYYTKTLGSNRFLYGFVGPAIEVAPGGVQNGEVKIYAGPKILRNMDEVAENLDRTVDYGWLWFIAKPLFVVLNYIHDILQNWGFSIIVLTILIKLMFYPLSAASYKSMAKMRKLQPRMMQIRERYGDDKQKMNQAIMQMYKTEKINPLGGCLPILVQIPFFIALYWVLLESVELRQAPFMLWIDDLSEHDPYFVLPLLMGASMFLQQKLNPTPPDPMQAKIMMMLPIVFTFLFLFFASGLVLYWLVNNILSITQQWFITKQIVGKDVLTNP